MVVKTLEVAKVLVYVLSSCGVFLEYVLICVRVGLQFFFDEVFALQPFLFDNASSEFLIESSTCLTFHVNHTNMGKQVSEVISPEIFFEFFPKVRVPCLDVISY